jgi:Zn-dependent protease
MNANSLTIGRYFGIQLRIHYSWLIIFALVAWSVTTGYIPIYNGMTLALRITVGLIVTVLFFVSVVCHEYAHSLVARSRGLKIDRITLFLFGGAAELHHEPTSAKTELAMTIAGPATSLLIALITGLVWYAANASKLPLLVSVAEPLCLLNLTVGIFNLLPAYPLDGGRILRSAIWLGTKDIIKATKIASYASYALAYAMMGLGVLVLLAGDFISGLWLVFLGYFLQRITKVSFVQTVSQKLLGHAQVERLMNPDFKLIPPSTTIDVFLNTFVLGYRQASFLVGTKSDVVGIMELGKISAQDKDHSEISVSDLMVKISHPMRLKITDGVEHALAVMQRQGVRILPVYSSKGLEGVITASYIDEYIAARGAGLKK